VLELALVCLAFVCLAASANLAASLALLTISFALVWNLLNVCGFGGKRASTKIRSESKSSDVHPSSVRCVTRGRGDGAFGVKEVRF
jgi:hypothetical protein